MAHFEPVEEVEEAEDGEQFSGQTDEDSIRSLMSTLTPTSSRSVKHFRICLEEGELEDWMVEVPLPLLLMNPGTLPQPLLMAPPSPVLLPCSSSLNLVHQMLIGFVNRRSF